MSCTRPVRFRLPKKCYTAARKSAAPSGKSVIQYRSNGGRTSGGGFRNQICRQADRAIGTSGAQVTHGVLARLGGRRRFLCGKPTPKIERAEKSDPNQRILLTGSQDRSRCVPSSPRAAEQGVTSTLPDLTSNMKVPCRWLIHSLRRRWAVSKPFPSSRSSHRPRPRRR